MRRTHASLLSLALPLALFIVPVAAAENTAHEIWLEAIKAAENAPDGEGGGGITLSDILRRVIVSIDSVDLDDSDTQVKLAWNINQRASASLEIPNEPTLYAPIRDLFQSDRDSLDSLQEAVSRGDEWTARIRYIHNSGSATADDTASMKSWLEAGRINGRAAAYSRLRGLSGTLATNAEALAPAPSPQDALALRKAWDRLIKSAVNVAEWELSAHYTQRDELAGPDEYGASFKYTWAPGSANETGNSVALLQDSATNSYVNRILNFSDSGTVTDLLSDAGPVSGLISTSGPGSTKRVEKEQRLSAMIDFEQVDDANIELGLASPFVQDDSTSFTGTVAYSLRWPSDDDSESNSPRYEFHLSYEDIDDDPNRQNRLLARAIISKSIKFLGEPTEVVAGLIYANKSEFLVDEDIDRELSATLALSFKFGNLAGGGE